MPRQKLCVRKCRQRSFDLWRGLKAYVNRLENRFDDAGQLNKVTFCRMLNEYAKVDFKPNW